MGFGIGLPRNFNSCRKKESMKVTIKNENKSSEIKYPCLMVSTMGCVVWFHKPNCGMVIQDKDYHAGVYITEWYMPAFTPFTGTVELSND